MPWAQTWINQSRGDRRQSEYKAFYPEDTDSLTPVRKDMGCAGSKSLCPSGLHEASGGRCGWIKRQEPGPDQPSPYRRDLRTPVCPQDPKPPDSSAHA